jgi:long-chain fatty acid transport protein
MGSNLHFVAPINDQFGWGASVTSNYGLATEFNNNYPAGEYGGKTDLTTLNLNLSGAYRLNDNWSFGLGFDAVYADAKLSVTPASRLPACRKTAIKLPA